MVAKCLNSTCSAPFRYLSDGRIFHLEIPVAGDSGISRRREYFWLCDRCSANFTVVLKNGTAALQSRFLQLMSGERLEQGEEEETFQSQAGSTAFSA